MTKRIRTASQAELNRNKARQAYMKAAGYGVPQDGSWGSYQQSVWDKLSTRHKQYDTTLMGLANAVYDKWRGLDTYTVDPLAQSSVRTYNPNEVDWSKTRKSQSKVVNALSDTWGPLVAAATAPSLIGAAISTPIATAATLVGGAAGGYAVDKASETLTGRDFGTNIAMHTPLTPGMGELLNPGYTVGGGVTPRILAGTDIALTALTGKSRDWMKPLVRSYFGEPYYNNIRPSGYANNDPFALSRNTQVGNMVKDILKPKLFRKNVTDSNYKPTWFVDKDNPTIFEMFRNDAHRLSMGLNPHQEVLPDGKLHSLYFKKSNGNYDVDWDYIRHIKQNYSDVDNRARTLLPTDFPKSIKYIEGTSPANGKVVANDRITLNGGFGTYIFNPNKTHSIISPYFDINKKSPTHVTTGDVTFMDTWDVQPLLDGRSVNSGLSTYLTKIENKDIPLISRMAKNIKNVELVDALGGIPFTQESKLPEQLIYWHKSNVPIDKQISANKDKFQTLNW